MKIFSSACVFLWIIVSVSSAYPLPIEENVECAIPCEAVESQISIISSGNQLRSITTTHEMIGDKVKLRAMNIPGDTSLISAAVTFKNGGLHANPFHPLTPALAQKPDARMLSELKSKRRQLSIRIAQLEKQRTDELARQSGASSEDKQKIEAMRAARERLQQKLSQQ